MGFFLGGICRAKGGGGFEGKRMGIYQIIRLACSFGWLLSLSWHLQWLLEGV